MQTTARQPDSVDVLIAEDDAPLRSCLRLLLEQQGYTCAEAENGREAVRLARSRPPQCVLLDLNMPELDGLAVARQLRSDPRTRRTHIDCLTGNTDPSAREQALRAGCELFLTKPIDLAALMQVVHEQVVRPPAREVAGLTKTQAEDLLDWLQANGYPPGELSYKGEKGFTVRPAGLAGTRGK